MLATGSKEVRMRMIGTWKQEQKPEKKVERMRG